MAIVVREIKRVSPKKIWPHTSFAQITSDTCAELIAFAKKLGLTHEDLINMRYHPHFRLHRELYDKAVEFGAKIVNKDEYSTFVCKHHYSI